MTRCYKWSSSACCMVRCGDGLLDSEELTIGGIVDDWMEQRWVLLEDHQEEVKKAVHKALDKEWFI